MENGMHKWAVAAIFTSLVLVVGILELRSERPQAQLSQAEDQWRVLSKARLRLEKKKLANQKKLKKKKKSIKKKKQN